MPALDFHLCHVFPEGRVYRGLDGYAEILETIVWGLESLGHHATCGRNRTRPGAINMIFGAQMLHPDQLDEVPPGSVVYNLEQMARVPAHRMRPVMRALARRFAIWDYCEANIPIWESLAPVTSPCWVKIGWAPVLARIPKAERQDIDVLFYGTPSEERYRLIEAVCLAGFRCVFASGIFGQERDHLIGRAKVVLNGSIYTESRIFEIARVSFLLANAKAVVTDLRPETIIEPDILGAVRASSLKSVVADCEQLIDDGSARAALERRAQEVFQARDIRRILPPAIERLCQAAV